MLFSVVEDIYQIPKRRYYQNIFISQSQSKLINDLKNELGDFKQYVFQLLPPPLVYIIGSYDNPTRFYIADAVDISPRERREIINTLKAKKVETIVVNMKNREELDYPYNIHYKKIMEFVEKEYYLKSRIGDSVRIYKKLNSR